MSLFKKDPGVLHPRFLLIFALFIGLACFPAYLHAQGDTSRRERPQPPPHPKPPSLKQMFDKVNIFKKHKKDSVAKGDNTTTIAETKKPAEPAPPAPAPPTPAPKPQPDPVKPKTTAKHTTKHTAAKKKQNSTAPIVAPKKTADKKPIQPLI